MKKSTLVMILCLVLAVALGVGGTLAYLTDSDGDVNVMTVGRVSVVQNEQQRVEENGEFTDELEPFVNDKMLLPVTDRNGTADNVTIGDHELELKDKYNNYIDKIVTATNTSNVDVYLRTFVALPTGIYEGSEHWHEYDAAADVWLHWNLVDDVYTHYDLVEVTGGDFYITVDGVEYEVWQFTHKAPVAPEETTYPVIRGLFMDKRVDMDEEGYYITLDDGTVHRIGNFLDEDGKMNVLVLTQAVQADGFDSADSALTQAFPYGEDNANVEKWFTGWTEDDIGSPGDKWPNNNPPITDAVYVTNLDELKAALAEGGYIILSNDITMDNMIKVMDGVEVTLDLNGKTIDFERNEDFKPGNPLFWPMSGSKFTVTGDGTIDLGDNYDTALFYPEGEVVIENGTFIKDRVPEGMSPDDVQTLFMGVKTPGASIVIKDGYFDGGYYDKNAEAAFVETDADIANRGKAADKNAYRMAIKNNVSLLINLSWSSAAGTQDFRIYGGTFVGANPAWGDEGCAMPITPDYLRPWSYYQGMFLEGQTMYDNKIEIPAGYTITEGTSEDGRPTFTVNYAE